MASSAIDQALGQVVKERSPISVAELAMAVGLSHDTVTRCLAGSRSFTVTELMRVAIAIGVTPATLIDEAERKVLRDAAGGGQG